MPPNCPWSAHKNGGIYQRSAQIVVMMAAMRSYDPSDPPSDDFEPAQLTISPDGGIDQTAQPGPVMRPPPRLCEQGPCVNYHRFTIPFDAEVAKAASIEPGGKLVGKAPPEPSLGETHHYCYPTPGIEFPLAAPVIRCNRWDPKDTTAISLVELRRNKFMASDAGKAYDADLAAWQTERDKVAEAIVSSDEVGELAAWITMFMRDGDQLEIRRFSAATGGATGDPFLTLDAPRSRENPDATLPPGSYRAWIVRNANNVTFKDFEVP